MIMLISLTISESKAIALLERTARSAELDDATGMYYYGARYYDPRISIFVSVDPLAEKTMTPYQYVHNNPIMFTDPTGMIAYPPEGEFGNGYVHEDSDGSWTYRNGLWADNTGQGNDFAPSEVMSEMNISVDKKPSKLSADLTNAYSASGIRHGV